MFNRNEAENFAKYLIFFQGDNNLHLGARFKLNFICQAKWHYCTLNIGYSYFKKTWPGRLCSILPCQVPIKNISEEKNERQGFALPASTLPTKTQANISFISPDIIQIDASVVSESATEHRMEKSGSYIMTSMRKTILDFSCNSS